jgi:hypothetical protein
LNVVLKTTQRFKQPTSCFTRNRKRARQPFGHQALRSRSRLLHSLSEVREIAPDVDGTLGPRDGALDDKRGRRPAGFEQLLDLVGTPGDYSREPSETGASTLARRLANTTRDLK